MRVILAVELRAVVLVLPIKVFQIPERKAQANHHFKILAVLK